MKTRFVVPRFENDRKSGTARAILAVLVASGALLTNS
jgi:hypothetical protein